MHPLKLETPADAADYLSLHVPNYLSVAAHLIEQGVGQEAVLGIIEDVGESCGLIAELLRSGEPPICPTSGRDVGTLIRAGAEYARLLEGGATRGEFVLGQLAELAAARLP